MYYFVTEQYTMGHSSMPNLGIYTLNEPTMSCIYNIIIESVVGIIYTIAHPHTHTHAWPLAKLASDIKRRCGMKIT